MPAGFFVSNRRPFEGDPKDQPTPGNCEPANRQGDPCAALMSEAPNPEPAAWEIQVGPRSGRNP